MESEIEIKDKIIKILSKFNNVQINENTIIFNKSQSLMDSLNIMNFICELEDEFGINDLIIKDITLSNFDNVSKLASFISKLKRDEKNG